jgi:hypothetical protein
VTAAGENAVTVRRDTSIDILRGTCIVLMIVSHLAPGSKLFRVTHPIPWLDGASGFFLLAGVVLGIVHQRLAVADSWRKGMTYVWRRTASLYALQIGIVLGAILVARARPDSTTWTRQIENSGTPADAVFRALTLRLNPNGLDILSVYVLVFLLLSLAAPAIRRGQAHLVAGLSLALYVAASIAPAALSLPRGDGGLAYFDWGAWQALFFSGYLVGWIWRGQRLPQRLRTHAAGVTAGAACVVLVLAALILRTLGIGEWVFEKPDCGPGRLALAWAAFLLGYYVLGRLEVIARLLTPLATLGRESLNAFVLMSAVIVVLPLIGEHADDGVVASIAAATTAVVAYAFAQMTRRRSRVR